MKPDVLSHFGTMPLARILHFNRQGWKNDSILALQRLWQLFFRFLFALVRRVSQQTVIDFLGVTMNEPHVCGRHGTQLTLTFLISQLTGARC